MLHSRANLPAFTAGGDTREVPSHTCYKTYELLYLHLSDTNQHLILVSPTELGESQHLNLSISILFSHVPQFINPIYYRRAFFILSSEIITLTQRILTLHL